MNRWILAGVVGGVLAIGGCAELERDREQTGAILGGAAGAVIGSEVGDGTAATIIGAIAGGVLGAKIGRQMDERDRVATAHALESNQSVSWENPNTGNDYIVNPTGTFQRNGRTCREFTMQVRVEGEPDTAHGTACRRDDGTWEIVG